MAATLQRIKWAFGLAVTGLVTTLSGAIQAADIQSVRVWRAPDNTRLVFDLSGPVQHTVFTLSAPERVVIDVPASSFKATVNQLELKGTPIQSVRAAMNTPTDLRVVLDLSAGVNAKSFTLAPNAQYGHRLVIDLFDQPAGATSNVATAAATASTPVPTPPPAAPAQPLSTPSVPGKLTPLPTRGSRDVIIAIDAGHGGEDPGALGPNGLREKHVVLSIAKELQRQLTAQRGIRAELTRTGDYFIPLRKRTEIARAKGADMFVSIHADAALRKEAYGASVFALSGSGATSETARWLADKENQSDMIGGVGGVSLDDHDKMLRGVLLDLSMTASMSSSLDVGQKVLNNMGRITRLHKRRVEQAGFMVLKSPDIPSILVETGFISNPGESARLATKAHQQALARAVTAGLKEYFHQSPPVGTYLAGQKDSGKLPQGPRQHVVSRGDTLAVIATRYQVPLHNLRRANNLSTDVIKVGQTLNIPVN
ncbi:N-acetylmuramoyl-L-alanine amidase [Atopomonas sediminilitoris]|uniref:N-acetylmuramoyl-L-alanine amidase n=1 Tax=Atopomonas sediminilitoris TaxID=2919919 RepID=UPI001F4E9F32|nr:N-acetylmuramoyl-L-alanine amidase [Atopomonas sediminilitoris]MCJ8170250.1 N-acetylmuramoyl-L-alanine amidase [Atopomonas sediminilitoris]